MVSLPAYQGMSGRDAAQPQREGLQICNNALPVFVGPQQIFSIVDLSPSHPSPRLPALFIHTHVYFCPDSRNQPLFGLGRG